MKTDFEDFMEWLADHGYCKVVQCEVCYFWGDHRRDQAYKFPTARCRHHKIDTYHDDYCSDAIKLKGGHYAGEVQ